MVDLLHHSPSFFKAPQNSTIFAIRDFAIRNTSHPFCSSNHSLSKKGVHWNSVIHLLRAKGYASFSIALHSLPLLLRRLTQSPIQLHFARLHSADNAAPPWDSSLRKISNCNEKERTHSLRVDDHLFRLFRELLWP
ncbi:hypothetical protein DEO72_LG8g1409 [Vigna unguiculata]|uniref:Uncharacterized protein n=1 Tax=Vigna unguiculata TaxID=3917 RepID=A0A4D6MRI2_VIGUN|nr:hypothetical protein DEO72_LG6g650 [Vigna unguiculata]QCE03384.1 hypothetical protein DEO72_LG8g1408 [Vigna unguiculata]QCE03385.1 hypothetical protein DEO72_LG8g1409 [Vigna unguiculata]